MLTINQVRLPILRIKPTTIPINRNDLHAAVAIILAGRDKELHICFLRRTHSGSDPWSGHIALPGGRSSFEGEPRRTVAEREAREEVGVLLTAEHRIGTLHDIEIRLPKDRKRIILSSLVYYLGEDLKFLRASSDEVAEAFWIPTSHLWNAENATYLPLAHDRRSMIYPAIHYNEKIIWGITLRVLTLFSDIIGKPLPHLEEIPSPPKPGHLNPRSTS